MNELTLNFFKSMEDNSEEGFQKTEALWKMSNVALTAGLNNMALQFESLFEKNKIKFSLLSYAVQCKNTKAFELLLNNGTNINLGEHTPLMCAVKNNLESIIVILLEHKADINLGNPSPLCCAIESEHDDLVPFLIEHGADTNLGETTPLWRAVKKNNLKIIQTLIDNGAEVNKYSKREIKEKVKIVTSAAWSSNKHYYPEQAHQDVQPIKQQVTPIYQAAEQEDVETIKLLLLNDADVSLKSINEKHEFELPEKYKEKTTETILKIENSGYGYYHDRETNIIEKSKKYKTWGKMYLCLEQIQLAKVAFNEQRTTDVMRHLCNAYDVHSNFFVDYLTNKTRSINLKIYTDKCDPKYLLKFLNIFAFLTKNAEIKDDSESYSYLQEKLLTELNGHDPEDEAQEIKLFKTRQEKVEFIRQYSKGSTWEHSFTVMKGETKSSTTVSNTISSGTTSYNQANLIQNLGLLNSSTNEKQNQPTDENLNHNLNTQSNSSSIQATNM